MASSLNPPTGDRSLAKAAILDVLHRYAYLAQEDADFEAMVPLFTPDGTFTLPNGEVVAPADIQSIVATGQPDFIRHHVTTVAIDFLDEDHARADTYFIAYTDVAQPDHWGRWEDLLDRQPDGSWLFADKHPIVEGYAPVSFWADLLAKTDH